MVCLLGVEKDQSAGPAAHPIQYQVGFPIRFAETWLEPTCKGVAIDPQRSSAQSACCNAACVPWQARIRVAMLSGSSFLSHFNPRASRPVQKSLEVEARETIVWPHTDMCRESSDRSFIISLHQLYRFQIAGGYRTVVELYPQRLERADGLGPAFQHKVPDQPPAKVWHSCRERSTHAKAGSELLVGSFQPRRSVDGVAISRVFKEPPTPEVADNRRSRMHTNPCDPHCNAFLTPVVAD